MGLKQLGKNLVLKNGTIIDPHHQKTIHKLNYKKNSLQSFTVEIEADGGIPIKRFVDGFNIIPNISSLLGIQCSCEKFDINQIYLSK